MFARRFDIDFDCASNNFNYEIVGGEDTRAMLLIHTYTLSNCSLIDSVSNHKENNIHFGVRVTENLEKKKI